MRNGNNRLEKSAYRSSKDSPGFLFWKVFNAWSRQLRNELDQVGLTQAQYSILAALSYLSSAQDHVSQQDIAAQLSMDKMMVSDVVKLLERKKMLNRKPNPLDGRSFSLSLTATAKRLLDQAVPVVESTDEKFFNRLNSNQKKEFLTSLILLSE